MQPIVSVKLVPWEPYRLGVEYQNADGTRSLHELGERDYPIVDAARARGILAYADDDVRALAQNHFAVRKSGNGP